MYVKSNLAVLKLGLTLVSGWVAPMAAAVISDMMDFPILETNFLEWNGRVCQDILQS